MLKEREAKPLLTYLIVAGCSTGTMGSAKTDVTRTICIVAVGLIVCFHDFLCFCLLIDYGVKLQWMEALVCMLLRGRCI